MRRASASTLLRLSVAQMLGLAITTLGSVAMWFVVARIAGPAEVGALGQVLSTSTFCASLITAGLGQYVLATIATLSSEQLRLYLRFGISGGALLTLIICTGVGFLQEQRLDRIAIATGLLGAGIALSNLQDAVYLGADLVQDVPLKAASVMLARLLGLLCCSALTADLAILLTIFVVSQLLVGVAWGTVRGPQALRRHAQAATTQRSSARHASVLASSYLYAIGQAAVITGIPALVTSLVPAAEAGQFYLIWSLATLLTSIGLAVANSVVITAAAKRLTRRRLARILVGLASLLGCLGLATITLLPQALSLVDPTYATVGAIIIPITLGNICFGLAITCIAAYRTYATTARLIATLVVYPLAIVASVAAGLSQGDSTQAAWSFLLGAIVAASCMAALALHDADTSARRKHVDSSSVEATVL